MHGHRPLALILLSAAAAFSQVSGTQISSLQPASVESGNSTFTLLVSGTGFNQSSTVIWRFNTFGAISLQTSQLNPSTLAAIVPAALVEQPAEIPVAVRTQVGDETLILTSNILNFSVFPGLNILNSCPLPTAGLASPYNAVLVADGGASPYTWAIAAGSLPPGLTLNASGVISGTANVVGTSNFTIQVLDSKQKIRQKSCSMAVAAVSGQGLAIFSLNPDSTLTGTGPLNLIVSGNGFTQGATVIWNLGTNQREELPTTLLNASQVRTVVPPNLLTQTGTFSIAVRQPNLTALVFSNTLEFRVLPALAITTACPLPAASIGATYAQTITATGGFPPYAFSVIIGALPAGISLGSGGQFAGTPTEAGLFPFTMQVTDSRNGTVAIQCSLQVLGTITVSPASLIIRGTAGKPSVPHLLNIACPGHNIPCSYRTQVDGPLIIANASSLQTPALIRVEADSVRLLPGRYESRMIFSSDQAFNQSVIVPITILIDPPPARGLLFNPKEFSISLPSDSVTLPRRTIEIISRGVESINLTIRSTTPWLIPSARTGTVPSNAPFYLPFTIDPAKLGVGTHSGFIEIEAPSLPITRIPVKVAVNTFREIFFTSQDGFTFYAVRGGPAPQPRDILVLPGINSTGIFVEGKPSTISGGPWLNIDPATNAARPNDPARFAISADHKDLAADLYFGDITFTAPAAANSPRAINTVLRVLPSAPNPFLLYLPTTAHTFVALPGSTPPVQTLRVFNQSAVSVAIDALLTGDSRFFQISSTAPRSVAPGQARSFDVSVTPQGLLPGVYRASIAISASGSTETFLIDILLVVPRVQSPTAAGAGKNEPARALAGCTPSRLLPTATIFPVGFVAAGGLPFPIEALVVDDCGDPLTTATASVLATFSNGNAPVAMVHTGNGRWSGTWPVQQTDATPATITLRSDDQDRKLTGTLELAGAISPNDGVPTVPSGAVLSTASFSSGEPLAPGSLAAIFGTQLADGIATPSSLPLPTQLGNSRVVIAGREAPLIFAGELPGFDQINVMLPYTITANTTNQLSVRRGTRRSNFVDVIIDPVQPAIFTINQSGSGQGVVVDGANPTVVVDARNPATRGSVVIIYAEGLGAVDQPVIAGQAVPPSPLARVQAPVTVTIGGQPAQVLFAGLTPFFTGLYQLNVTVPQNLIPGDALPVIITAGGKASLPVSIAVR
ncbi:MAG: putative Ig domain-containing protein [Acidobacteriia bacterium]|nr:putative Ig domain-containing protein [Terriglobia bacterium]